ncbi:MAG: hypothetical protein M5U28_14130 [Sandaracinaceae bacterium]|nr:hypothetical protein [Sandaracinaceae bacterium]
MRPKPTPRRASHALAAALQPKSRSRKLAPITMVDRGPDRRPEPVAVGPFVASSYISIAGTCPQSCPFRTAGCYAGTGSARALVAKLDAAAEMLTPLEVVRQEAELIDRFAARGVPRDGGRHGHSGRDLRLHVSGDVRSRAAAQLLGEASERYRQRGGGRVWTYTHSARVVHRADWGDISVLASVENPRDVDDVADAGYAAAIVVPKFPSHSPFRLPGSSTRFVPCPQQTRGVPCVKCRLCFDSDLRKRNIAIAFEAHGPAAGRVREALRNPSSGGRERRRLPVTR